MTLRLKVILLVSLTQLLAFVGHYWVADTLLLDGHKELESSLLTKTHERLKDSLSADRNSLSLYASDWGSWDDTYEFIISRDYGYVDTNFSAASFEDQHLNLVAFYALDGHLVFGQFLEGNLGLTDIPQGLVSITRRRNDLLRSDEALEPVDDLIVIDGVLWLFSSQPILTSTDTGPVRGTLLMGRKFEQKDVNALARQLDLNLEFSILPIASPGESRLYRSRGDTNVQAGLELLLRSGSSVAMVPIDDNSIDSFSLVSDLRGRPIGIFAASTDRSILVEGRDITSSILYALVAASVLTILLVLMIQDRLVLFPLGVLRQQVLRIKDHHDLSDRVNVETQGELGDLAQAINITLTSFEETEQQLQKEKQALEAATAAKTRFLAHMSHELRTPLNGILGMIQMLTETPLNSKQAKYVHVVENSGNELLTVINDILNFEKLDAGKVKVESIPVDLRKLISNISEAFEFRISSPELVFISDYDDNLCSNILMDPVRLQQVLNNLLSNAFKFTTKGKIHLRTYRLNDSLCISVEDTGIGISDQGIENLFQSFSQADSSTTRKFGGTGLGLSICKMLVELMDGSIKVESIEGRGSTFIVNLPLRETIRPELRISKNTQLPQLGHLKVLVADDNRVNRMVIKGYLKKFGIDPEMVDTGTEAVEKFKAHQCGWFDLILMDINMPDMDGHEATRSIRTREKQNEHKLQVPIYALTADVLDEQVEAGRLLGMNGHLAKPVDINSLCRVLTNVSQTGETDQ